MIGWPWASVTKTLPWEDLKSRAEGYSFGTVPVGVTRNDNGNEVYYGPLILCGGGDVQKDRIELIVVGFGPEMERWIVDYRIFYGDVRNLDDPCWIALDEHVYNHSYSILGKEHLISKTGLDCGYDPANQNSDATDWSEKPSVVHEFVAYRQDRFFALMGVDTEKAIDIIKESRVHGTGSLKKKYHIAVSLLKESIMASIQFSGGPRSIHVPRFNQDDYELPDDFYKQFLSERYQEIAPKKFGWKKIYKRNEVLDTFVYANAAAHFQGLHTWTLNRWANYYYACKQNAA